MRTPVVSMLIGMTLLARVPPTLLAQNDDLKQGILFLTAVEKEEARAKEIRLKWIGEERDRIRSELQQYNSELEDLKKIVPDPIKPRVLPPAQLKARERDKVNFNAWTESNDPVLNAAIAKGVGLNALLRVLGPIAHYRRMRTTSESTAGALPSLSASEKISATDATHFRLAPCTSGGTLVTVRLNQLPLDLEWPPVVIQHWGSDCKSIHKLRDAFVMKLNSTASEGAEFFSQAELLDSSLSLLQAKVQHKRRLTPQDTSLTAEKRNQVHRDLQDALRYLETVRATATRFKNVPGDYKVLRFPGGTVEDLLDYCYTHGMSFQESRPADQQYYLKLHRHLQDYAHDIQYIEDWKSDLEQRIRELSADDRQLVWRTSEQ